MEPAYDPIPCTDDSACCATAGGCPGACDTALGYCRVDPYYACDSNKDCAPDEICSEERGFCLRKVFSVSQCDDETPCESGECNLDSGWCLPTQESEQCVHDDQCPAGHCTDAAHCDKQTFVFPQDFDPEVDCLRAR